ncbi:hypothetical protein [Chromobacterium piscinae]|uniref:hypothetical protein n=1 Tax=Chromobacterium piscinae TaxID=686831 RepID=UPI0031FC2322
MPPLAQLVVKHGLIVVSQQHIAEAGQRHHPTPLHLRQLGRHLAQRRAGEVADDGVSLAGRVAASVRRAQLQSGIGYCGDFI